MNYYSQYYKDVEHSHGKTIANTFVNPITSIGGDGDEPVLIFTDGSSLIVRSSEWISNIEFIQPPGTPDVK